MASYTALTPADVEAIAAAYGLGAVARCEPLWAGTINSNFRLETGRGPLFLRVNEGKARDEVAYEAELVAWLAARGVPTPRPLATTAGEPWADVGGRLLTLFPWTPGRHPEPPRPADAHACGAALARVHLAGAGFPERRASRYAFERIVARARGIAAAVPELDDVRRELDGLALPDLPVGIIHGDLFPDNVLVDDGAIALLDFEQASDGVFVYDLAVCLLSWCWTGSDLDRALVAAMREGYATARPLSRAEEDGLLPYCRFAAARFTVTRLTDVELNPLATAELRKVKDYRDFYARLVCVRALTSLA